MLVTRSMVTSITICQSPPPKKKNKKQKKKNQKKKKKKNPKKNKKTKILYEIIKHARTWSVM